MEKHNVFINAPAESDIDSVEREEDRMGGV
jgi:hypothetical protein